MKFMFPSDPMKTRQIDAYFKPQADALVPDAEEGFTPLSKYALFSQENMRVLGDVEDQDVVYRGWMLTPDEYWLMNEMVEGRRGKLWVSYEQYVNTHHLPNWYLKVPEFTAETLVFPKEPVNSGLEFMMALDKALTARGWNKFFVKDYVKSLKTGHGSVVSDIKEMKEVIDQMKQFRGTIEGGLCVRKFEDGLHQERRYFVVKGRFYGPLLYLGRTDVQDIMDVVMSRIDSPFYSVDIALNAEDKARIVEIGDGQVSDLADGWTPESFREIFAAEFTRVWA